MNIKNLQKLAGLELGEEERRRLEADLERLRDSIDRLDEVEVDGVDAAFEPVEMVATMGGEEASVPLERAEFLERVPEVVAGQVAVPQTVSGGGGDGE